MDLVLYVRRNLQAHGGQTAALRVALAAAFASIMGETRLSGLSGQGTRHGPRCCLRAYPGNMIVFAAADLSPDYRDSGRVRR